MVPIATWRIGVSVSGIEQRDNWLEKEGQVEHNCLGKRPFAVVTFWYRELLKDEQIASFISKYLKKFYRVVLGWNELICAKGLTVSMAE